MEPSIGLVERIMHPFATFARTQPSTLHTTSPVTNNTEPEWLSSMLNPQNRPDSLNPGGDILWRMDGCQTDGHRLFITPRFAFNKPPQRVDIYLSDEDGYRLSEGLRRVLELNKSMTVPSKKAWRVPLSQHILRALEHWSQSEKNFEKEYKALPFGSYIAVETICADQAKVKMHLVPWYETEREWMSVQELAELWSKSGTSTVVQWPEIIDLQELRLIAQPHEAISIVKIPKLSTCSKGATTLFAFKSVLDDLRYMYHELWRLLTLAPHPNMVARPLFIVTTRSRFGAKEGVCGFVLEYFPRGTMRDLLVRSRTNRRVVGDGIPQLRLSVTDKFRIAREITSALLHLQALGTFYPGIKYTNVVMRERWSGVSDKADDKDKAGCSTLSPVLIDFDQRAGRYIWTPPEIHHSMHVEYLANASDHGHMYVPEDIRTRAANLMRVHWPTWQSEKSSRKRGYRSCWDHGEPLNGFSAPWLALTAEERDRCQVYMLGRLLWHLFEEVGAIDHCLHIEVFREACDFDAARPVFPAFSEGRDCERCALTPEPIRRLIQKCTAGAPEWHGKKPPLVYRKGRLWADDPGEGFEGAEEPCGAGQAAQEAIRSWWADELQDAERFILDRRQEKLFPVLRSAAAQQSHRLLADMKSRPLLQEVSGILEQEEASWTEVS
ncbi:hypothetical protein J7T55_005696 [Diaporthe amygdali]|uniref:uncharacterized protein n=1 Tax=Phomopsis amygdali TaxID=1214568 RepID=UPI0022FF1CD6|nr:uncharacterized protein J7T55_005696 [Diaporthe amygdali]KAJ0124358.1 hypothetical protein J7T55_005696 [Diaporthe amygdali]